MEASDRLHPSVIAHMRAEIAEAGGSEVLFVCGLDEDGLVETVEARARGNLQGVPAVREHMERGHVIVHNHPNGVLRPSDADLEIAGLLGEDGIGSMIVDNQVTSVYVIVEPLQAERYQSLDIASLLRLCGDDGALARTLPVYEPRRSQLEMLEYVGSGLNAGGVYVAEAGTGVGKSIAYLVPAFAWLDRNPGRVVISTATINLQQQLIEKDVPLVRRAMGVEVKAVLVKGRGNYLCPYRLDEAATELVASDDQEPELSAVREWASDTASGSRSDLPFPVSEELWSRVNSDADHCSARRCWSQERCFLMKARREAAAARVLVVNHHLLFSDLAIRLRGTGVDATAVLPPFQQIVFDEAHHLENSATSYFSQSFSPQGLEKQCARLHRRRRGRVLGLLPRLEQLGGDNTPLKDMPAMLEAAKDKMRELNAWAVKMLGEQGGLWLPPVEPDDYAPEGGEEQLNRLIRELQQQALDIAEVLTDRLHAGSEHEREEEQALLELAAVIRRFEAIAAIAERFARRDQHPELVCWLERRVREDGEQSAGVRFTVTPLEIRELMHEAVYLPYRTVFFTSATLTVKNSFGHWAERVGLDDARVEPLEMRQFESPFDYRTQVLMAAPHDAPTPEAGAYSGYLVSFLGEALSISEGSALILFTSYRMLTEVYRGVKPRLQELGITAMRQGDDDRGRLLQRFNSDVSSVLFATESFWAGVDAPGDTLRVVVLCRLPFRVPTDPVLIARMERIKACGGNPFRELTLPDAVMRFRQGFGRLIRSSGDRGVVIITDTRVLSKSYGRTFIDSVPQTAQAFTDSAGVLRELERFLYR